MSKGKKTCESVACLKGENSSVSKLPGKETRGSSRYSSQKGLIFLCRSDVLGGVMGGAKVGKKKFNVYK